VLGDVREALRDHVVGRDLHALGQAAPDVDGKPDGQGRARRQRLERDREAMAAEDGGMDSPSHVPQLLEREPDLTSGRIELLLELGLVRELLLEQAQPQRQRDQPLLRAVVEIPLEPLALLLSGFDHAGSRSLQLLEASPELRVQAPVLERDAGGRADSIEQLVLVVERAVVDQGGDTNAVSVDRRRCALVVVGQLDRTAVQIDVGAKVGQPVRERQRGIPQRLRQRVSQVGRLGVSTELDHQLADRRSGQPRVEQPEQEGDRRQAEQEQRHPLDLLEGGPVERADREQDRHHDEPNGERVDQDRQRPPARAAEAPPPGREDPYAEQAHHTDGQQLDVLHLARGGGLRGNLDEVRRSDAAEHHLHQLQPDRGGVCARDEHALEP
jgi:hypothetical protein